MNYKTKFIATTLLLVFCSLVNAQELVLVESDIIKVNPEIKAHKTVEQKHQFKIGQAEQATGKYSRILSDYLTSASSISKKELSSKVFSKSDFIRSRDNGDIQVYLSLTSASVDIIGQLRSLGVEVEVVNKEYKMVQGWVSVSDLLDLASNSFITKIASPNYSYSNRGSVTSEGVSQLKANGLAQLGHRGKGVKVGIVSSGANDWRLARDSGDLPEQVTVYGSCTKRRSDASVTDLCSLFDASCNEGTAMAEIVHDIAPEAEIGIAAVGTSLEFISQIERLINEFGADIIVDDLGFLLEPSFYDGPLATAIDAMPNDVLFVSSAGNNGYGNYRAKHKRSLRNSVALDATTIVPHNFSSGSGFDPAHGFVIPANSATTVLLKWDGRPGFFGIHQSFRLWVADQQGGVIYRSPEFISRPEDAIFGTCIPNQSSSDIVNFALVEFTGGSIDRPFQLQFFGRGAIEYPFSEGSIFGHAALERVIATGAINADTFSNNSVNFYSSRGPALIYQIDGGESVLVESRSKPDIIAVDGVSVTGSGGFASQFFGTSAAAPHIAGVAAQLMSVSRFVKPDDVRSALLGSARDIEAKGFDSIAGHGIADALAARELLKWSVPLPGIIMLLDDEED